MMNMNAPSASSKSSIIGVSEAIVAYLWWGFVTAMYYKQLDQFPPMELLTGRVLTGIPLMLLLIALPPGIGRLIEVLRNRRTMAMLALSTFCISLNWLTFIYAVIENRLMEASIGYFINPLVSVMLGRIFLGERLNLTKSIAVGIAAAGVVVFCIAILMTQDARNSIDSFPWIPFVLPASFGMYGLLRKQMKADSVTGLTVELLFLTPPMLAIEAWFFIHGTSGLLTQPTNMRWFFMLGGFVTIVPIILFAGAARRLQLGTTGVLQYIAPTGQFIIAVTVFNEEFTLGKGIAFGLIWVAVITYSSQSLFHRKRPTQTDQKSPD